MVGNSLIPDKDRACLIPHTTLQVLAFGDMIKEEVEDAVRLLLVEADWTT